MRKIILLLVVMLLNTLGFSSCKDDLSLSQQIYPKDTTFLDRDISEEQAIKYGNELISKQVTVSRFEGETYAHDSKLLIVDGIGYCAYYGNDKSKEEGVAGQSVRMAVFDIENPQNRVVYDIFKSGVNYNNGVYFDVTHPCYTPVLFKTSSGAIRVLSMVYQKGVSKYYYRDFDINTRSISDPKICKIRIDTSSSIDFDISNVSKKLKTILKDYNLATEIMGIISEPVKVDNGFLIGITIGKFTANWQSDEGTTIIAKTDDEGQSFTLLGAPDSRRISNKYNSQSVEAAFVVKNENEIIMLCRNSLGGMVLSKSVDNGFTFSQPYSLNEACNFNIRAAKPNFIKIDDGYLTIWNTRESFISTTDRTVVEIRYGKNSEICGNKIKIKIKTPYGCHYPSICKYKDSYYLTYTCDTRKLSSNSTGEIAFVKLPI